MRKPGLGTAPILAEKGCRLFFSAPFEVLRPDEVSTARPFVGMIAGAVAVSEPLRRLNGGAALELVSGSALSLGDVGAAVPAAGPYAFGHLPAVEPVAT